ncbi:M48 family metallopeptidase [Candidatus Pacearchaeota archaeon]|nr:M48 family metallopeptidase [Candidatus Pacearchaeota archaeon]
MPAKLSFEDEITKNKIKSVILIGVVIIVFILLGYIIANILNPGYFFVIMIISIIFSLSYSLISYYNSDKIALASVNAKPASPTQHRQLISAVENMSLASGLPMPKVYVMESDQINAFASGRDPQHAVICVTSGSIKKLNKQELEGVIAHEMSHIANFDIRFMTLATVLIGMISILAEIFLRSLWMSGDKEDKKGGILIILGILFAILAPIASRLVALSISRKREFTADATGVKFTRYPPGLASALKKIKQEHAAPQDTKKYPTAVAPLFISDPFKKRIQTLLSTHPDINDRISRLERM